MQTNVLNPKFRRNYNLLKSILEWRFPMGKTLIEKMVSFDPSQRLNNRQILRNIFFWREKKIMEFFCVARVHIFSWERNDSIFQQFSHNNGIFKGNWKDQIHEEIIKHLEDYLKKPYNGKSTGWLIRAIRNAVC